MPSGKKLKLVVLGAGPSGLSAAHRLAAVSDDFEITVLEKEPAPGGLSASFTYDGFIFDYGPHNLHVTEGELLDFFTATLGDSLIPHNHRSKIFFRGKLVDYPLKGLKVFTAIGVRDAIIGGIDFLFSRLRLRLTETPDDTYEDWIVNRFGRTLFNIYFGPYSEKVWGLPTKELSPIIARKRIPALSLMDLIKKTLFGMKGSFHSEDPSHVKNFFPRRGIGELSDKLAEALERQGHRLTTSAKVTRVLTDGGRVRAVEYTKDGETRTLEADYLLSTIPIPGLIELIEPRAPARVTGAARSIRYRGMILLYVGIDREQVFDNPWIYFSHPDCPFNRLYEVAIFSRDSVPRGKTALCFEITCQPEDPIWGESDQAVFDRCMDYLEPLGFFGRDEVSFSFTKRLPVVYPIFELGYEQKLGLILDYLHTLPNLVTFGRQGLFSYVNIDNCFDMGFQVAEHLRKAALKKTPPGWEELFPDYRPETVVDPLLK